MSATDQIQYLQHHEIDTVRWDQCISSSLNGLPYAFSWYLDRVTDRWDALVLGNYLYVMPLPAARKMGINYLLQPMFTQQLGVFSPFEVSPEIVDLFLKQIPARFRLIALNLNSFNYPASEDFTIRKKVNYQLDLSSGYQNLCTNYSDNTKRNLKKASGSGLQVFPVYNIPEFIGFAREYLTPKTTAGISVFLDRYKSLINYALSNNSGKITGIYSDSNSLCAAVFFLRSHRRHIYLIAASSPEGLEKKAMFYLVDQYIRENAGKQEILDFEGSNIEGVARFYAGFGATPEHYFTIIKNRLPWPIKLFKKV